MTETDQPRPDLDAAVDAVVPSLTAVSDDAAAASLRRTRIALSDTASRRATASAGVWRWAVPAVLVATVLVAVLVWRTRTPVDVPPVVLVDARRPAPLPTTAPVAAASVPAAPRVNATHLVRTEPGSAPREPAAAARRRDPLADLIDAVQQIPEDAWRASRARAERPVVVAEVPIAPITVNPLDTPSISTLPADPIAPGEP